MLLVDKRERMLAEVLRQTDVEFVLQTLPVGDVMWQETGRSWIAERKRADDLAATVDGNNYASVLFGFVFFVICPLAIESATRPPPRFQCCDFWLHKCLHLKGAPLAKHYSINIESGRLGGGWAGRTGRDYRQAQGDPRGSQRLPAKLHANQLHEAHNCQHAHHMWSLQ